MEPKVVVITGGSAGIGAALGQELGRRGWRVVLAARREEELRRAAARAGAASVAVVADVTRRADVERVRDEALRACGRVDAWINNAGQGITRHVLDLTDDDVDAMIAVNLKSALYGMQAIVPYFQQRGAGHLVNVSSFLGRVPLATVRSMYSAAKAGLNSLTANLRMELRATHPGVHVTLVLPGIVTTEFATNVRGGAAVHHPAPGARTSAAGQPQTADEVAIAIAGALDHPVAELYTNPAHPEIARRYFADVAAFEAG